VSFVPRNMWDLLTKELAPVPMRIGPGVLPKGGTLLIGGQSKIGKTFLVNEISRALITATPLFGLPLLDCQEPTRVLSVEGEVGEWGVQKRARVSYAGVSEWAMKNLFYITKEEAHDMKIDSPMTSERGFNAWCEAVRAVKPEVVIIDPVAAFHGSNENESDEVEKIFARVEKLKAINPSKALSVILVHHTGKPAEGKDPLDKYSIRGSSKWVDRPDTIMMLERKANLKNLPHTAWQLNVRFTFRQAEDIDDMKLNFNERADCRVRFVGFKSANLIAANQQAPLQIVHAPPVRTTTGEQLPLDTAAPF
jgi:RecA-family ATPase